MCYRLNQFSRIVLTAALAVTAAACGKSDTAQASNRDGEPKSVGVAIVQKASVPRAVDVVGTLAAVDQVTVSSEADGKVQSVGRGRARRWVAPAKSGFATLLLLVAREPPG